MKDNKNSDPNVAAIKGFLFVLPFFILNFIMALRVEPFYSFLGSFPVIRNSPFLPLLMLLLFPVGAFIALKPVFKKNGERKYYPVNIILGIIMLVVFGVLFVALGQDMYRCDVLKIPNCD